jgi:hypothetical protein
MRILKGPMCIRVLTEAILLFQSVQFAQSFDFFSPVRGACLVPCDGLDFTFRSVSAAGCECGGLPVVKFSAFPTKVTDILCSDSLRPETKNQEGAGKSSARILRYFSVKQNLSHLLLPAFSPREASSPSTLRLRAHKRKAVWPFGQASFTSCS